MEIVLDIVSVGEQAQAALIELRGNLNARSVETLKTAIGYVLEKELYRLVIDLKEVPFVDSSGLSALVWGFKMVRKSDGVFLLANLNIDIRMGLQRTRLDQVLLVHDDVATALESFERQREVGSPNSDYREPVFV